MIVIKIIIISLLLVEITIMIKENKMLRGFHNYKLHDILLVSELSITCTIVMYGKFSKVLITTP